MIKLKALMERYGDAETELPHLEAAYNMFHRAPTMKKIQLARLMITGPYRNELTAAHVYHLILGLPRDSVVLLYQLAKDYLTDEQLKDVKQQIETFYTPRGMVYPHDTNE